VSFTWFFGWVFRRRVGLPEARPVREQLLEHGQLGLVKDVGEHVLALQVPLGRSQRTLVEVVVDVNLVTYTTQVRGMSKQVSSNRCQVQKGITQYDGEKDIFNMSPTVM